MNEAQKLAIKKFEKSWVVDTNFIGEPIVYTHKGNSPVIEEYVITKNGEAIHTATYPRTVKLRDELKRYI
jgi:hypothetical protein